MACTLEQDRADKNVAGGSQAHGRLWGCVGTEGPPGPPKPRALRVPLPTQPVAAPNPTFAGDVVAVLGKTTDVGTPRAVPGERGGSAQTHCMEEELAFAIPGHLVLPGAGVSSRLAEAFQGHRVSSSARGVGMCRPRRLPHPAPGKDAQGRAGCPREAAGAPKGAHFGAPQALRGTHISSAADAPPLAHATLSHAEGQPWGPCAGGAAGTGGDGLGVPSPPPQQPLCLAGLPVPGTSPALSPLKGGLKGLHLLNIPRASAPGCVSKGTS